MGERGWTGAEAYEQRIGRWSRLVACEFVDWLGFQPGMRWLDVGCGTGALSNTILQLCAPAHVAGVDRSTSQLDHARKAVRDERIEFHEAGAEALPFADGGFDRVVSGLVINFVGEPARALAEMVRVARPGGRVGAYVWDFAAGMEMMRRFWDAAVALDPAAAEHDTGRRYPICRPGPLAELFAGVGLEAVATRPNDVPMVFADFDEFWMPCTSGSGSIPTYYHSLGEAGRAALEARLDATLPRQADGSIHLNARAWTVKGTV